jgi:FAD/FMN-containing dehydrogenase
MTLIRFSTLVLFLSLSTAALATEWELRDTNKDLDINVYTRDVAGSLIKEYKGETTLQSTLKGVIGLMNDIDNRPNWLYNLKSNRILKKGSDTESIVHSITKSGPFMQDRDSVIRSTLVQNPESKVVTITLENMPDYIDPIEDALRIQSIKGQWTFTPVEDGMVHVSYNIHAIPGGSVPRSLVNRFIVKSPLATLKGMHEQVENYQNQELAYIVE